MSQYLQSKKNAAQEVIPWDYDNIYHASLGVEGLAASTMYNLIDLSDVTNFPHEDTDIIYIHKIHVDVEIAGTVVTDAWDIWIGVVTEVDATNGSLVWIEPVHMESRLSTQQDMIYNPPIRCKVNAAGDGLTNLVANQGLSGDVLLQTDVNLVSPVGSTSPPGAGDLVMYVEEVQGTGTIDFHVSVCYHTE